MTLAPDPDQTPGHPGAAGASAGLLRVMLDNMRHGIALFDAAGRLVAANRLASLLTGLPEARFGIGRTLRALIEDQAAAGEFGSGEAGAATLALALGLDRSNPAATSAPDRTAR